MSSLKQSIRSATHSGSWYEADDEKLSSQLNRFLLNSEKEQPVLRSSPLMGIIAPHAGYSYSGETASYAYNEIKKEKHSIRYKKIPTKYLDFINILFIDGYSSWGPLIMPT
jgi:predicted class III extradiol MEMO1 family dioxygenase